MKRTDQEQLLNDVLGAEANADQNATALDQLLQLAQRRRHQRQLRRGAVAMFVFAAVATIWWIQPRPQEPVTQLARNPASSPSYATVTSFALMPEQITSSQLLSPEQLINSTASVIIVQTMDANYHFVSDEELLELARPNIAALVRRGPQEVELVLIELPPAQN